MGVAGREVLRWLSQPHVLQNQRAQFETLLLEIAEYAEEWLTSAQAMGLADRHGERSRVLPWDRASPQPTRRPTAAPSARAQRNGKPAREPEFEFEHEV